MDGALQQKSLGAFSQTTEIGGDLFDNWKHGTQNGSIEVVRRNPSLWKIPILFEKMIRIPSSSCTHFRRGAY